MDGPHSVSSNFGDAQNNWAKISVKSRTGTLPGLLWHLRANETNFRAIETNNNRGGWLESEFIVHLPIAYNQSKTLNPRRRRTLADLGSAATMPPPLSIIIDTEGPRGATRTRAETSRQWPSLIPPIVCNHPSSCVCPPGMRIDPGSWVRPPKATNP